MNSCRFNPDIVRICLTFVCLLWLGAVITWAAADHYIVPTNASASSPFTDWGSAATNIQHALNAAGDGDTVWITNGTYFCQGIYTGISGDWTNTAMVVVTNAITVRSFNGQYSNTIVNGYWPAYTTRVFYVDNTGAVVSGLTITNGFVITNQNQAYKYAGAGVFMRGGLLTNCLVTGNIISNDYFTLEGAGIFMYTGTVSHCIIMANRGLGKDTATAGIYALYSDGSGIRIITNCLITGNVSSWNSSRGYAQACKLYYGPTTMTRCTVSFTTGDGISLSGSAEIESCVINNNARGIAAGDRGKVRNSLIFKNSSYGIENSSGGWGFEVRNCTIAHNGSQGIYIPTCRVGEIFKMENNIIFYNGAGGIQNWYSTNLFYTNCCTYPMPTNTLGQTMGTGNITNAPSFVDTNSGNYRLTANSPCINAGTNQSWMTNACDLDWSTRIRYGKVDIGAYEHINKGTVYNFQ